jgi:hypothetical protein
VLGNVACRDRCRSMRDDVGRQSSVPPPVPLRGGGGWTFDHPLGSVRTQAIREGRWLRGATLGDVWSSPGLRPTSSLDRPGTGSGAVGIALRHKFDDDVGHIGYGSVRPRAVAPPATWAFREIPLAGRALCCPLLVRCLADNVASARTIERCRGVLEGIRNKEHGPVRRYWIHLN